MLMNSYRIQSLLNGKANICVWNRTFYITCVCSREFSNIVKVEIHLSFMSSTQIIDFNLSKASFPEYNSTKSSCLKFIESILM